MCCKGRTEARQSCYVCAGPDPDNGDARGYIKMSTQAVLAGIVGLAFCRIKIREIETVLKVAGIYVGITEFGEEACAFG